MTQKKLCCLPETKLRQFDKSVTPERANIILSNGAKWVNGTQLKYYFFGNNQAEWEGSEDEKNIVRAAFEKWEQYIGISFKEVSSATQSHIRIGFLRGDGSWSYVGRDILEIGKTERTMNFGWDISTDLDTALHEIGHTLGLQHEHQNPRAGIIWNEPAVYEAFSGTPNFWDTSKIYDNIIKKYSSSQVSGSRWDPDSIMHYPFGPGLIEIPQKYTETGLTPAGGLSQKDIETIKKFYPKQSPAPNTLKHLEFQKITAKSGEQQDFIFKPDFDYKYKIQTIGNLDILIVLFEKDENGAYRYLSGSDDSGTDDNSFIEMRLLSGREYMLRARVLYNEGNIYGGIIVS